MSLDSRTPGWQIRSIRLGRAPNCSSLGNVVNTLVWSQAAVAALWVAAEAWRARRSRDEPDGGRTLRIDNPPALVRTGEANGSPHEAHVQVTSTCALPCANCHVEATVAGAHVPIATVAERFERLASDGVFHVAIGGGEALGHPDLTEIASAAHRVGLTIGLTTSGVGDVSRARSFDQVNVSLDGLGQHFRDSRGYNGAQAALAAIRQLAEQGSRVGVNILLTRSNFDSLDATIDAAIAAGARDIHLLRLKPTGRASAHYLESRLTEGQSLALWPRLVAWIHSQPRITFRVDCAMTPFIAAHRPDRKRMQAFGWLGCHGGDALVAVNVDGTRSPCSFSHDELTAEVAERWRGGVTAEPCASCDYRQTCRGGCHAVALSLTGDGTAPDPECPIVAAHTASHASTVAP